MSDLKAKLGDPKIIFVLGGPASGKGTQCELIVEEFGFTHLSTGDLFRAEIKGNTEIGQKVKSITASGQLVPSELTCDVLIAGMLANPSKTGTYLIDGFPRAIDQATIFEKKVGEVHQILYYDVPQEIMEQRCLKRAETSGRADDNETVIKQRVQTYFDETVPVVEYYKKFSKVNHIDAMTSISEVYKMTKAALLPQLMLLLGPKSSGKSTVGKELSGRTNCAMLDFDEFVVSSGLVGQPDDVISATLIQALARNKGRRICMENFPHTLGQAKYLLRNGCTPTHVIQLECSKDMCQERMIELGQDHPNYIRSAILGRKFQKYYADMADLIPYFKENCEYITVSTDQALAKTMMEIYPKIEPLVIHVRPGGGSAEQLELQGEIVSQLAASGFVPVDAKACVDGEVERCTAIGQELAKGATGAAVVKMLNAIIYCGQPDKQKFILVNFPEDIAGANQFEANCAKIAAMIYPNAAGGSKVEVMNDRIAEFNIDSLFQKESRLKPMTAWSDENFEEAMGRKVSYGVILGEKCSGKTVVGKYMAEKLEYTVINTQAIEAEVRKSKATEEGEFEGEITLDETEAAIVAKIKAAPKARYVFDDYPQPDDERFIQLVSQFGQPEFLLCLEVDKDKKKQRYNAAKEQEDYTDEDKEAIKADIENVKAKKQALQAAFERVKVETQGTDNSIEAVCRDIDSKFCPRLILVNHEKKLAVDTVCANLALKYNMLYISAYQLIKKHIECDTKWGQELKKDMAERALTQELKSAADEFDEAKYSPVHFKMQTVCAVIKECIAEKRTNQAYVLLEGMCNHKKLANEDDQMEVRYMDEFFALEELVAKVGAVISLGYEFQTELVAEVKVDPKQDEERKAALAAKERAKREKAKAEAEEGGGAPEEEEGVKKETFEPLMFNWSNSNKEPKNLAQLYNCVKGGNFVPDKKDWSDYAADEKDADVKVCVAKALDDFCSKIDALDDEADKCWYVQVKFPEQ